MWPSHLLGEARPERVLGVAEGGPLKDGCGKLEHLAKELVEFGEQHDATRVRHLRENICQTKGR